MMGLLLAGLCLGAGGADARRVEGAELPETLERGGTSLALNGAGPRRKYFVHVYIAALYLEAASHDAVAILAADRPMAVRLHVISRLVTPTRMRESIRDGFERSTGGHTGRFRDEIQALLDVYHGPIAVGDTVDLVYLPGRGIEIWKNGERTALIEAELAFKRALFGIWLSEGAVQANLREALLGR